MHHNIFKPITLNRVIVQSAHTDCDEANGKSNFGSGNWKISIAPYSVLKLIRPKPIGATNRSKFVRFAPNSRFDLWNSGLIQNWFRFCSNSNWFVFKNGWGTRFYFFSSSLLLTLLPLLSLSHVSRFFLLKNTIFHSSSHTWFSQIFTKLNGLCCKLTEFHPLLWFLHTHIKSQRYRCSTLIFP